MQPCIQRADKSITFIFSPHHKLYAYLTKMTNFSFKTWGTFAPNSNTPRLILTVSYIILGSFGIELLNSLKLFFFFWLKTEEEVRQGIKPQSTTFTNIYETLTKHGTIRCTKLRTNTNQRKSCILRSHLSVWMQLCSILAMGGYTEGPQIWSKLSRDTAESFPTHPTAFFPTEPSSIHLKTIMLCTFRQATRGLPCALFPSFATSNSIRSCPESCNEVIWEVSEN